ncbi:MAG: NmrA family NAD(P)-binding protein [Burkholderiaceae bacterium]
MSHDPPAPILVFGATGRVGQAVVRDLLARGLRPRCAARDPSRIAQLFDGQASAVAADMRDAGSLREALRDGDRVFLMSPVAPDMAELQAAVIDAARGRAARIVKLSGSTWTQTGADATFSGLAHRQVEQALDGGGTPACSVRPMVFSEGFLRTGLQAAATGTVLPLPMGDAAVAFAEVGDIAAVCAKLLADDTPHTGIVEVSCPEAITGAQLAALAGAQRGTAIAYRAVPLQTALDRRIAAGPASPFELMHLRQMLEGIQAGRAGAVSLDFERVMGRPAASAQDIVVSTLSAAGVVRSNDSASS